MTRALEDYLETIFRLATERGFARVRDIAAARDVRSASVVPALRRLSDMGLIDYARREYVALTPEGERQARRVYAKHCVLTRFFHEVLEMSEDAAEREACAMEHNLSDEAMDRLVSFFEFLGACPNALPKFLNQFHACPLLHEGAPPCPHPCEAARNGKERNGNGNGIMYRRTPSTTVFDMEPGDDARVIQVNGQGGIRQRLLDMGILPQVRIKLARVAPMGDPVWIELDGTQLALRREEAKAVIVRTA